MNRSASPLSGPSISSAGHSIRQAAGDTIPSQPGDTTVFGWQMMALKSASMAGLDVPSPVVNLAERFLDSVQSGGGAYYGYMVPTRSSGPTAVGLLIRMYTGWDHYDPRLQRGVAFLAKEGPSKTDMYFNYYATQVMHHYGGPDLARLERTDARLSDSDPGGRRTRTR